MRPFYFVLSLTFLIITANSLGGVVESKKYSDALNAVGQVMSHATGTAEKAANAEIAHKNWGELARSNSDSPRIQYEFGRSALLLALLSTDKKQRSLLCEAFRAFSTAAQLSPHRALYQIGLADIETAISHPSRFCAETTNHSYFPEDTNPRERLSWAALLAPWGSLELYYSALVNLSLGERGKALDLLRVNDEFNPQFSRAQRELLYRLVRSEAELDQALPRRFPEIVNWIAFYRQNRPQDYLHWNQTFASALNSALTELEDRWREQQLSASQYSEYLTQIARLPLMKQHDLVRQKADRQLASAALAEHRRELARFLTSRSKLQLIPTLKAFVAEDRAPNRTEISGWQREDSERQVVLRSPGENLGVYLPQKVNPTLLVIRSNTAIAPRISELLEILVSSDNTSFVPFKPSKIDRISTPSGEYLVLTVNEFNFRVAKIRLKAEALGAPLENSLGEIIQVYGSTF